MLDPPPASGPSKVMNFLELGLCLGKDLYTSTGMAVKNTLTTSNFFKLI